MPTATVAEALERELDGMVAAAIPTVFHGDMHEGNIIAGDGGYRLSTGATSSAASPIAAISSTTSPSCCTRSSCPSR